ncbi:hypothetical protein BH11MYX1_BH11MYX1_52480 [soil metagenome]
MRWLSALVLVIACGKSEVGKLEGVKNQVCACKDLACAETAMKALPTPDHQASHREQVIARDVLDCYARLVDAAKPVQPAPPE